MEEIKRRRCIFLSVQQKKKLLELVRKHSPRISRKVSSQFTHEDLQKLWEDIANECNSIPGAKKSWKQWRKTWQDLKCNTKRRQREEVDGNMCDQYREMSEFEQIGNNHNKGCNDDISNGSESELDATRGEKVFTQECIGKTRKKIRNGGQHSSKHSNCYLNCDMLARQEQKKIQMKEDYLNFKKNYLRQKLKLLKEQTDALKSIASELKL